MSRYNRCLGLLVPFVIIQNNCQNTHDIRNGDFCRKRKFWKTTVSPFQHSITTMFPSPYFVSSFRKCFRSAKFTLLPSHENKSLLLHSFRTLRNFVVTDFRSFYVITNVGLVSSGCQQVGWVLLFLSHTRVYLRKEADVWIKRLGAGASRASWNETVDCE